MLVLLLSSIHNRISFYFGLFISRLIENMMWCDWFESTHCWFQSKWMLKSVFKTYTTHRRISMRSLMKIVSKMRFWYSYGIFGERILKWNCYIWKYVEFMLQRNRLDLYFLSFLLLLLVYLRWRLATDCCRGCHFFFLGPFCQTYTL